MTGSTQWRKFSSGYQTSVTFVDDIDGSTEGVEHYAFSWLGRDYEIDLAPKSAKKLIDVMNLHRQGDTGIQAPAGQCPRPRIGQSTPIEGRRAGHPVMGPGAGARGV